MANTRYTYNVREYGARGDDVADDYSPIFQILALIDTTASEIYFPPGTYVIGTSLTIPSNVTVNLAGGAILSPTSGKTVTINGALTKANAVFTAGAGTVTVAPQFFTGVLGAPVIVARGRLTGQTAAVATVATYTVGSADGSFEISANVLATVSTTYSFDVTVTYTDEGGTSRTSKLEMLTLAHVVSNSGALANTNGPLFAGLVHSIRAKAGTTITIATSGTFTTVTYNVEGTIKQIA